MYAEDYIRQERKGVVNMSGLYIGTMGIISNMVKMDVHSNNVANASTNGYKTDQEAFRVFEETYMRAKKQESNDRIGQYHTEMFVDDIRTNFEPGSMLSSSAPLDFAIQDQNSANQTSFFVVGKGNDTFLTRNGHFVLDANRHVSTANGGQVLDINGNPITIPEGVNFFVNEKGSFVRNDTNEELAQMKIQTINKNDLGLLKKEYGGYFSVRTAQDIEKNFGPIQGIINEFDKDVTLQKVFGTIERLENIRDTGTVNILQPFENSGGLVKSGSLETSNVDLSKEMIGIINAQKGVQFGQKVFNTIDKVLEKAANEIAR